jgi:uncharacterized membrane protein
MRSKESIAAGSWFTLAGATPGLCLVLYLGAHDPNPPPHYIYGLWVVVPAVIAGISGLGIGGDILNRSIINSSLGAAKRGIRIACTSLVIYLPLMGFAASTQYDRISPWLTLNMAFMYLIFGSIYAGWLVVIIGALAGLLLYQGSLLLDTSD